MKQLPDTEYLRQCFDYNEVTGDLTWRERPRGHFNSTGWYDRWNKMHAGSQVTSKDSGGYLRLRLNGEGFLAHRVIWKLVHGFDPSIIDHADGNRENNAISNLRSVSPLENVKNASRSTANTSGVTGVSWHNRDKRWRAFIRVNRRSIHLGNFKSFDEAVGARKSAERKYGFHKNHGRISV